MIDAVTMTTPKSGLPLEGGELERELERLAPELLAFLKHHCGDPELAQDLAQDALVRAMRSLDRLKERGALRGWLFRIAVNRFNDYLRAQKHRETQDSLEDPIAPVTRSPEGQAMTRELDQLLRAEMALLPERQRTVLLLHGVQHLDQRAIAELLEITPAAVKMSLFHARERLRKRLEAYLGRSVTRRGGNP